jgi:hypothetical protein
MESAANPMQLNLTTALIALAVLVLVGIAIQGVWWSRRVAARRLPVASEDTSERREPALGTLPPVTAGPSELDLPPVAAAARAEGRPPLARRSVRLDPLIDAIATISVESPMTGQAVLPHVPGSNRAGNKPFYIEGLNAETGEWEPIAGNERYGEFQAGVQMANRNGALNEIEFSEFVQKVEAFAQGIGATSDTPDMLEAVARGRVLDGFAGEHDAQLVAMLRANSVAWSIGYLQQCAQRHGFVPGVVPGRLVLPAADEGAPPVLTLNFDGQAALAEDPGQAAVRELVLGLDVAQTEEALEPFTAWQGAARSLADDLDAAIVDDQGRPITLHAFAAIHAELKRLYEALAAQELPAGSPGARRLFS